MKIFIIGSINKASGGSKVLNQVVNLFIEKGYESFLVTTNDKITSTDFLKNHAPAITLSEFQDNCRNKDIIINCWQEKNSHNAVINSPAKIKIFWQHGIIIPKYPDFNGEEIFKTKKYHQYWNVSRACANYIEKKYNIEQINIVHPFFDDNEINEFLNKKNTQQRDGILVLRRRGAEAIPDIIKSFSKEKITILNNPFTTKQLYNNLIKHKYFVSTDNGISDKPLIMSNWKKIAKKIIRIKNKALKLIMKTSSENTWVKHNKNLLGFPMSACEAAWLDTTVIAFAMGGGLEWMNNDNIYLAKDNDIHSLIEKIKEAAEDNENNLNRKKKLAFESVKKFNKEHTWEQLRSNLNIK